MKKKKRKRSKEDFWILKELKEKKRKKRKLEWNQRTKEEERRIKKNSWSRILELFQEYRKKKINSRNFFLEFSFYSDIFSFLEFVLRFKETTCRCLVVTYIPLFQILSLKILSLEDGMTGTFCLQMSNQGIWLFNLVWISWTLKTKSLFKQKCLEWPKRISRLICWATFWRLVEQKNVQRILKVRKLVSSFCCFVVCRSLFVTFVSLFAVFCFFFVVFVFSFVSLFVVLRLLLLF